ncbi:RNA polymerase sigma factor (sigma-70 family) [Actinomadura luteofluorescens]|uniref:RNA polymerase sigma factor (Sigma-70 family) n=1 Tax=Actinomadura luteofluorescens TaxID=46163 RepID=A0A7Y9ECI8_9ACTN|nr:RNA polymerase sigma factor (sigma-70 family) [Actinomadura luteofluorescens]
MNHPGKLEPDPGPALLALYDTALPEVYGYLLPRCGRRALAEDLTAETFLAAVEAVRKEPPPALSVAWLVGVARHKLADHWRRAAPEQRGLQALDGGVSDPAEDPWDERLDALVARDVLGTLAPHHRAALTLRYLDGLPVPHVAEHLGRTLHATEALLTRARKAFRHAYTDDCPSGNRVPRILGWHTVPEGVEAGCHVEGLPDQQIGLFGGQEHRTVHLAFAVEDLHEAVRRIRHAGGDAQEPTDEPFGLSAACTDDQDLRFSVYQPAEAVGPVESGQAEEPGLTAHHGEISYLTIGVPDIARARSFYGEVLNWEFAPGHTPGGWSVRLGGTEVRPMTGMYGGADRPVVITHVHGRRDRARRRPRPGGRRHRDRPCPAALRDHLRMHRRPREPLLPGPALTFHTKLGSFPAPATVTRTRRTSTSAIRPPRPASRPARGPAPQQPQGHPQGNDDLGMCPP